MKRWQPVDVLITLLGLILFLSIALPMVRSLITGVPITQGGIEWISKILLAVVAIISMYVGARLKDDDDNEG